MTVRPVTALDAPACASIYAPSVEGSAISFEEVAPDARDMLGRMDHSIAWRVDERDGVIAGFAYAGRHRERAAYRWAVDVAVYVDPAFRRQGVGRALYADLLPAVTRLGYFRAYAGITLPNAASVGLHEAVGFTPVGVYRRVGWKHGAWHDVGWWELDLRGDEVPPGAVA